MARQPGKRGSNAPRPIILRRSDAQDGGHHGGSWKIAYADFMTAMMAFFLVMWLINATTEQQRRGIASFFNPLAHDNNVPLDAMMPINSPSPMARGTRTIAGPNAPRTGSLLKDGVQTRVPEANLKTMQYNALVATRSGDHAASDKDGRPPAVAQRVHDAVSRVPATHALAGQVHVSGSDGEVRISIEDSDRQPMFLLGQAVPNAHAVALLQAIAPVLGNLPGVLSIGGYTDASPYRVGHLSNWTLSAQRADAARDILVKAGFPDWRLRSVVGHADRDLVDSHDPLAAANRRIVLTLIRKEGEASTMPTAR
ncbi:flagellar motor protein MotB [Neoasaia chiangmaiensis NBRC 101099]|uniref:Uncharacterized protein n=1 Tax=Neoasaia chiangmaiensis TaxID=320497 RepID=A0A1U9KNB0_9PROT|nr:flagellar motor protein MotB [Neoasaia chiangmaiensis]AQS87291.1 hypothetical protein A0U93_04335 [Neoasaia chiangmaiensis]GBR38585.1 flagellar motor protein MotB [Neoasaia chiangmaiensis NBRC 101099]GEN15833.1 chemotaxis protein MotB [Neoasaia chiangmaiensis]